MTADPALGYGCILHRGGMIFIRNTVADFKKFLDHYLKWEDNEWELTPRARISVISYSNVRSPSISKLVT